MTLSERKRGNMTTEEFNYNITALVGCPVTVVADGRRFSGILAGVSDTAILVDGWRILMSRVSAWAPGKRDLEPAVTATHVNAGPRR